MIIIGIDPDSKANGVAVYENGVLIALNSWNTILIYQFIEMAECDLDQIEVHIEDVNAVSAAFNARDKKTNINVKLKMAQHIGKCKHAQIEVERVCEYFGVKVVKHKISKMWKDKNGKKQFEMVTGWTKRSNEDTRSAAYFGFLGNKTVLQR